MPDPLDPQSLNRYSYVYNNPLKYTDPSGHFSVSQWFWEILGPLIFVPPPVSQETFNKQAAGCWSYSISFQEPRLAQQHFGYRARGSEPEDIRPDGTNGTADSI